jgi:hypothetical protein
LVEKFIGTPVIVVHTCNSSSQEGEGGKPRVGGQPRLHSKFIVSLETLSPKKKKNPRLSQSQWLMPVTPVILATWEAEIRRTEC